MQYRLWTYYRADGAVLALVRAESDDPRTSAWTSGLPSSSVFRTFTYDSLGRRLSSDDPDTDDPNNGDDATNSWRYLFNRVGDLAAVRDPRGCGQNFFYDLGGRLVGEQYVSCGEAQTAMAEQPHADNSVGHLTSIDYSAGAVELDVVYHYDTHPSWATSASILPVGAGDNVLGRATGVSDRGQRAVLAYDDRGNVTWTARQLAFISDELALGSMTLTDDRPSQSETAPGSTSAVEYDEAHTYVRTATFDHAGRPRSMTLPQDPDYDDVDPAPIVGGVLVYNRRGLPWNAAAFIGCEDPGIVDTIAAAETACSSGTVQHIIDGIDYLRDGLVGSITYGDDFGATRDATVSTTEYDSRRRPTRFTTIRDPDSGATSPELGAVSIVVDQQLTWDAANNLTEQLDLRDGAEWPAGHRPQTVYITHDSLYRVIGADYDYTQSNGTLSPSDDSTDWRDDFATTFDHDPMRQRPAPMASAQAADRVVSLTWSWDYLANTTEWTDDAGRFYERSLGGITNGDDESSSLRPSALYLASNIGDGTALTSGGGGWVEVDYGVGGNVIAMTVHSQCDDDPDPGDDCADPGGSMATRKSALRDQCLCQVEQHYIYRWDELNRLAEARRYDRSGGSSGTWDLMVRQRYRYDGSNQRTVKQTLDQDPPMGVPAERIALYAYPGDFERRGLVRDAINTEYEADGTLGTETQYVIAGARTVWTHDTLSGSYDRGHRLTIPLSDLIQTTAAVLDARTGALLETSTYYPNGARESYQTDNGTLTAPEVTGYTGKEGDEAVGAVYCGQRYLITRLGRWASPDPLSVNAGGGDEALNSYHYISGNLLSARDSLGLARDPLPSNQESRNSGVEETAPIRAEAAQALDTAIAMTQRAARTDRVQRGVERGAVSADDLKVLETVNREMQRAFPGVARGDFDRVLSDMTAARDRLDTLDIHIVERPTGNSDRSTYPTEMQEHWDYYQRNANAAVDGVTSEDGRHVVIFDSTPNRFRSSLLVHETFHTDVVGYNGCDEPRNPSRYQEFVSNLAGLPHEAGTMQARMNECEMLRGPIPRYQLNNSDQMPSFDPFNVVPELAPEPEQRRGPHLEWDTE